MKRFATAVLTAGSFLSVAYAGDPENLTDPVEILKRADAATKTVNAVSYSTTVTLTGAAKGTRPDFQGQAFLSGWGGGAPTHFRYEVRQQDPGEAGSKTFTAGSDGENYYLIDHKSKTAYVDIDPQVMGSAGRTLRAFGMLEFVHPTPFSDEINGKTQKLEGVENIGNEPCYKIHVEYASGNLFANWYFSTKDFLPRGVERLFETPDGKSAGRMMTLTKLKTIKTPSAELSAFKLPEGYTQTDDFAP